MSHCDFNLWSIGFYFTMLVAIGQDSFSSCQNPYRLDSGQSIFWTNVESAVNYYCTYATTTIILHEVGGCRQGQVTLTLPRFQICNQINHSLNDKTSIKGLKPDPYSEQMLSLQWVTSYCTWATKQHDCLLCYLWIGEDFFFIMLSSAREIYINA